MTRHTHCPKCESYFLLKASDPVRVCVCDSCGHKWTRGACCEMMVEQLSVCCPHEHDYFECPDRLIIKVSDAEGSGYGLIIHDGGESYIRFRYCPWCGGELSSSDARE